MGKRTPAPAPSIIGADASTWRPVVTALNPPQVKTPAKRKATRQQQDIGMETILNDRLG